MRSWSTVCQNWRKPQSYFDGGQSRENEFEQMARHDVFRERRYGDDSSVHCLQLARRTLSQSQDGPAADDTQAIEKQHGHDVRRLVQGDCEKKSGRIGDRADVHRNVTPVCITPHGMSPLRDRRADQQGPLALMSNAQGSCDSSQSSSMDGSGAT